MQVYAVQVCAFVVPGLPCVCAVRVLYVCARRCRSASLVPSAFPSCVCSCLSVFASMPVLSMGTRPGCVPPRVIREYSTLPWGGRCFPIFQQSSERTDRAGLGCLYLVQNAEEEVEAGQNCQLPAAASRGQGLTFSPPPLRAARDGRGRRQQVVLLRQAEASPGPLPGRLLSL